MIVSTFFGKIKHDYSDFQIDDNDLNILRDIFKDSHNDIIFQII